MDSSILFDSSDLFDEDCEKMIKHEIVKKKKKVVPWVDKYRPKKLDDIVYQDDVTKMLKNTLITGELPHLLLYGPPGTGKTSTILAIGKELFGPKIFHERVIELNASDERGIGIVRDKIVKFAMSAIGAKDPDYLCPNYKIIVLDEADAMTTEAQSALRKTIEENSRVTRFCFICNYKNQIINPIVSRCFKFKFKPIAKIAMFEKLKNISIAEKMEIDDQTLQNVIEVSEGDMRKAIMLLQNLKYIYDINGSLTPKDVFEVSNCFPKKQLEEMWKIIINKEDRNAKKILELTTTIINDGYPLDKLMLQIFDKVVHEKSINDEQKSLISIHLGKTEKMLNDGSNEFIQLLETLTFIKGVIIGIKDRPTISL